MGRVRRAQEDAGNGRLHPGKKEPDQLEIDNDERAIGKLVRRLEREAQGREIRACYEAGTCGHTLQRRLEAAGKVVCDVVAPSHVPRKPGERIKTDTRYARKLVELHARRTSHRCGSAVTRAGSCSGSVPVPTASPPEEEARAEEEAEYRGGIYVPPPSEWF